MTTIKQEDHTAELGVLELRRVCANAGQICREVLFRDVGIDAFIESVQDGAAQGRLCGVQVKTGSSFVKGDTFGFRTDYEHLVYWAMCAFPVIAVIHDPVSARTAWINVSASCSEERFRQEDCRLEVAFHSKTAFTTKTLLADVMAAIDQFYGAPRLLAINQAPIQLEPRAAESAYETWFRLIGVLLSPSTPTTVAADAVVRLSRYMPTVTLDQKAAVVSAMQNLTDFQLLKLVAVASDLFNCDDNAPMHVVDLLGYNQSVFARLEDLLRAGFVPEESRNVVAQMIEVHEERERPDLE